MPRRIGYCLTPAFTEVIHRSRADDKEEAGLLHKEPVTEPVPVTKVVEELEEAPAKTEEVAGLLQTGALTGPAPIRERVD